MKLHHSNQRYPKTLQHCCHSCQASDSLVCVGSLALFVTGSWRFHWQVRKRSRSILTDVRRRCILKMGLPDVGWQSADISFYCPLNVSEWLRIGKGCKSDTKSNLNDDVHDIQAFSFLFSDFLPPVASGKICEKEIRPVKRERITRGGGSESSMGISLLGIQPPAFQQRTGCLSRHDSSVVPSIRFVRPVPKYLPGIWFTLNSNWMQNKIKTTPLNWAWPGIIRADQSHYSSKVKSSPARSVRSHRRDCHSRKALRLEADNHLGRLSG